MGAIIHRINNRLPKTVKRVAAGFIIGSIIIGAPIGIVAYKSAHQTASGPVGAPTSSTTHNTGASTNAASASSGTSSSSASPTQSKSSSPTSPAFKAPSDPTPVTYTTPGNTEPTSNSTDCASTKANDTAQYDVAIQADDQELNSQEAQIEGQIQEVKSWPFGSAQQTELQNLQAQGASDQAANRAAEQTLTSNYDAEIGALNC